MKTTTQPRTFRKKPVVVHAMQYDGSIESAKAIEAWVNAVHGSPVASVHVPLKGGILFQIRTALGGKTVFPHYWVISGMIGISTMPPDLFQTNYEEVKL